MNPNDRLELNKMIGANNTQDFTEHIRDKKHSSLINMDVQELLRLKTEHAHLNNPEEFDKICMAKCSFLFMNYTDIYNKIIKDEIDITILNSLLKVLKDIENGLCDQHEGSFKVGKLLKEIYIDSALRTSEHLDKKYKDEASEPTKPQKNISWRDYKMINT